MSPDIGLDGIDKDIANSMSTRYVGVASFTVLVWDHVITFSDKVEYIWKGRKGPAVYLFFVNRYLIPLSFIVGPRAYSTNSWPKLSRGHFVRYGGAMTMIGVSIVFLMMFLRIRALYERFLSIQAFVLTILLVNSYVLSRGTPVHHPAQSHVESFTMIVDQKVGRTLASSTAWLSLLYGTVVISLTLYRTTGSLYTKSTSTVCRILFREGLLYYSVISTITLVLTIVVNSTVQSIRGDASQLHLFLTVAMMSRITLRPKRFANSPNQIIYLDAAPQPRPHPQHFPQHFPTVSQPMTSASPPALSSIRTAQQKVRSLLPSSLPCGHARASASLLSSSENVSYLEKKTLART